MSDVNVQDPSAVLDWTMSWANQLTAIDKARASVDLGIDPDDVTDALLATWRTTHTRTTLTGTSTVVCPTPGVTPGNITTATTAVTWRLTTSGLAVGTTLTLTVHVTLSTGEQDERDMIIHVRNT